jgi:hypothetical protein
MKTLITMVAMAFTTGGFAASASGQEPQLTAALAQLKDGASVAVREDDGSRTTGRLVGTTDTLLTLTTKDGRSLTVPLDRVRRVWVEDPASNGMWTGAAIGGGIGVAGAIAVGALCANEGGPCAAAGLLLIAGGAGAGAGIGALADKIHVRTVFVAGEDAFAYSGSRVVARIGTDRREGRTPLSLGASWGITHVGSGIGFEANVDRASGTSDRSRTLSTDMRLVYLFGKRRVQPFASAGAGYNSFGGQHALVPVVGAGASVRVGRKLSLRPEVSFYGGHTSTRGGFRTGIGLGYSW